VATIDPENLILYDPIDLVYSMAGETALIDKKTMLMLTGLPQMTLSHSASGNLGTVRLEVIKCLVALKSFENN